jgi:hypothetical protein
MLERQDFSSSFMSAAATTGYLITVVSDSCKLFNTIVRGVKDTENFLKRTDKIS